MKFRYMVDCVPRHDENGRPCYEPVGVWVQGPGPGLDIEMFYIESNDPAVLARKDEANWVLNRLVEADITSLPDDFLEYHRQTRPPYDGAFADVYQQGISLNMTKEDTIALLDKLEPGKDHAGLMGQELVAAKAKHGIGVLKNKQQLVEALQKKAGQKLAEKAKQEAVNAAL